MDFALLKEHPWTTVAIIGGGGLLLYIVFRRGSGGASSSAGTVVQSVDPNTSAASTALQAQQDQIAGSISGLTIQGQTQIALAQIGAGVSGLNIYATQDVTNRQTDAQLQLGLGTLDATVKSQQISAGVQMATINALVTAFGGTPASNTGNPASTPAPYNTTPVINATGNPIIQNPQAPSYSVYIPTGTGGTTDTGIIPGGTQLVPFPAYAACDPRDSACVARNQQMNVGWVNNTLDANASNNRAQCLANAELSKGQPNYAALIAACG